MNEILTYILGQIFTLAGFVVTAWIFGRAFAHGVSNELKRSVPKWIHDYVKETRDARTIASARERMDELKKGF